MRTLPDWIEGYVKYLHDTESPHLFKKWVAVSTVAACLRRKCYINWHRHAATYPNFYIVLVGPPAVGKGLSMGPASSMLRHVNVRVSAQSATRQALIRDLTDATESEFNPDTGDTIDHSSLTIFSKELAVFLNQKDNQLISDLTDWYDCEDRWTYDTVSRGKEHIEGLFVNLIGATTPDLLSKTLPEDAIGGGLTSRIIFIYADRKGKVVPVPFESESDSILKTDLVSDLERICTLSGCFKFSEELIDKWVDWYTRQEQIQLFSNIQRLIPYTGRRPTHLLKLLMVTNASRTDSMIITGEDFDRSVSLLEEAEHYMPFVFRGYGRSNISDLLPLYMNEIMTAGRLLRSDFANRHMSDLDAQMLDKVLLTLQNIQFCRLISTQKGTVIEYIPEQERSKL